MIRYLTLVICTVFVFAGCLKRSADKFRTYLDTFEHGQIVNLYGPPKSNISFGEDSIIINNIAFERGLGVHAPSKIRIGLNGMAAMFTASVGVDHAVKKMIDTLQDSDSKVFPNYVYDNQIDHYDPTLGGSVVFKVFADDKLVYKSEKLTAFDDPVEVQVDLKHTEVLKLLVEPTEDGSYADHANWGNAAISWIKKPAHKPVIEWYPEEVLVNHVGFMPDSYKKCYLAGTQETAFQLINNKSGEQVYQDKMIPQAGDLGNYVVGDFSEYKKPGQFYIEAGGSRSVVFKISEDVYIDALKKHVRYINQQRSGDPDAGWIKGQHLDDGIRQDNGKHHDVTGGWYDASDLRKPMKGNSLLLLALTEIADADITEFDRKELLNEMKWGNKFLFAMQEPEGYVMSYIGSTKNGMMDNRWTDNIVGNEDDRTILTQPADVNDQLIFAMANARIARIYKELDDTYAARCWQAAIKAWKWSRKNQELNTPNEIGIASSAAIAMYQVNEEELYKRETLSLARDLLERQQPGDNYLNHHFFEFTEKASTYSGRWIMMGLQEVLQQFPNCGIASEIKKGMGNFATGYYQTLAKTNAFSVIPWVFATSDLGSGKQLGPYFYRNFLHVGMNQHLSSQGCALVSAYNVAGNPDYLKMSQCQLDWIYGANPFNASSVTGLGYNQPTIFKTLPIEFVPHTPELVGGVMTGIGSDKNDNIAFFPGWWWTTEYWSPSVTYTMLLVANLIKAYGAN